MWYSKFQKRCRWMALSGLVLIGIFSYFLLIDSIPDKINIVAGEEEEFDFQLPLTGEVKNADVQVLTNHSEKLKEEQIRIDMADSFTLESQIEGNFSIVCKLFGIFSIKEVDVEVIHEQKVVPCGFPIGIYVETDGVLAIGTGVVEGMDGLNYEPAANLVKSGDYIKSVNDVSVDTKEELIEQVNASGGEKLILGIVRNGEQIELQIDPVQTGRKAYKIGVWVRDDMAGVGTLTYYTTNLEYGALGHQVSDIDTGTSISLGEGSLYETEIVGITKGEKGAPGQLSGVIQYRAGNYLGSVLGNSETGIHGVLEGIPEETEDVGYLDIAFKQEVETGPAEIISYVSGERQAYQVEILSMDYNTSAVNKGICFKVTDSKLMELTGGIVQGMSGSPILQNGKIVGAVTHVLVNDPTRGYAIFIENMLEH